MQNEKAFGPGGSRDHLPHGRGDQRCYMCNQLVVNPLRLHAFARNVAPRSSPAVVVVGFALASSLLSACSSSGPARSTTDTFPAEPTATAVGDAGELRFELRTLGAPARGYNTFELTVFDQAQGSPRDDLSVDVTTWMPAMGHGSSTEEAIDPEGGGRYKVSNVTLYMPGTWELRASVSGGATDRVVFSVVVP